MPNYDYVCEKCNYHFEANVKMAERDSVPCPKCGGDTVRQVSAPDFILKGEMAPVRKQRLRYHKQEYEKILEKRKKQKEIIRKYEAQIRH